MIVALGFSVGVCFIMPIIYMILTKRRGYSLKPFFIGALTFFISQMCLRIPFFIPVLEKSNLRSLSPIIYLVVLAFSAGIFEESGRWLAFKFFLKDKRSFRDGLSFGIGHGVIEAIMFLGITTLGMFMASINPSLGEVFGISQMDLEFLNLSLGTMNIVVGTIERIFAITLHIGLSIFILDGMNRGRKGTLLIAIVIHGVTNLVAILLMPNVLLAEGWLFIIFIVTIIYLLNVRKTWNKESNLYC